MSQSRTVLPIQITMLQRQTVSLVQQSGLLFWLYLLVVSALIVSKSRLPLNLSSINNLNTYQFHKEWRSFFDRGFQKITSTEMSILPILLVTPLFSILILPNEFLDNCPQPGGCDER
jgi:hypothetical protein